MAAQGGYTGLQGVLSFLQQAGGINANQYGRLGQGYTGNWQADGFASQKDAMARGGHQGAGVGGAHGAFSGLSSQAVEWLMKNVMTANAPKTVSLFGPANADGSQGAALTGDDLWLANMQNQAYAAAPKTYGDAHSALTAAALQGLLHTQFGGGAYAKGYNASGRKAAKGKGKGGNGTPG